MIRKLTTRGVWTGLVAAGARTPIDQLRLIVIGALVALALYFAFVLIVMAMMKPKSVKLGLPTEFSCFDPNGEPSVAQKEPARRQRWFRLGRHRSQDYEQSR
jgi:hypothetical protein